MSTVKFKNSELYLGAQSLAKISSRYGAPVYVYDLDGIRRRAEFLKSSLPGNCLIHYAMKANSNIEVLRVLRKAGLSVDVVSGGEMKLAFKAGFRASDIVFSGVGKTVSEIEFAIRKKIRSINVESYAELVRILALAERMRRVARVSLRLNPNVNAGTHRHITTGRDFNKFGLSSFELRQTLELLNRSRHRLQVVGLTFHLGSQIQSLAPFKQALKKTEKLLFSLLSDGHPIEHLSVGGGLAIKYSDERPVDLQKFGKFIRESFRRLPVQPMCEPGRVLVGEFGVLLTEVQYVKDTGSRKFAIVDTGMHHLMRPALYDAYHEMLPLVRKPGSAPRHEYEVVGPICESTDVLGRGRKFAELCAGDRLAILNAGAYGYVMANRYNLHALPREIVVTGSTARLSRSV